MRTLFAFAAIVAMPSHAGPVQVTPPIAAASSASKPAPKGHAAGASQGLAVGARVLAVQPLRLVSTAGEPDPQRRPRPATASGMTLRIDPQLQSLAAPADG